MNNVPKDIIIKYLKDEGYDHVDGNYNYLLNMPIYSLTKERYEKLLEEKKGCEIALKTLKETEPKEMYISDLKELKKAVK